MCCGIPTWLPAVFIISYLVGGWREGSLVLSFLYHCSLLFSLIPVYINWSMQYLQIMPEAWRHWVLNMDQFSLPRKQEQLAKIYWMSLNNLNRKWLKDDNSKLNHTKKKKKRFSSDRVFLTLSGLRLHCMKITSLGHDTRGQI